MSDTSANALAASGHRPMGFPEFVIVIASIMALNPLAMDMMLPALPDIGRALGIDAGNRLQAVLSTFLIGFGAGQLVMGTLSDRFGRRPVLLGGIAVYCIAGALAVAAPSFETLLLARLMQGFGTSATRVIATSIVRDCYTGRRMASVVSLAMMIFIAVPVLAPSLGQLVMLWVEWHGIFVVLLRFMPYLAAYTIAYIVGVLLSYFLLTTFVFHTRRRLTTALRFPLVYIAQYLTGSAVIVARGEFQI